MLVCNIGISVGVSNVAALVFVRVTNRIAVTVTVTVRVAFPFVGIGGRQLGTLDTFLLTPNLHLEPLQHQHNARLRCTDRRAEHQGKIHGVRLPMFLIPRESIG